MKITSLIATALSGTFLVITLAGCQGSGDTENTKKDEPATSSQESSGGSGTK